MYQQKIPVNEPTIFSIRTHANLQVEGWDQPTLEITSSDEALQISHEGNRIAVNCHSDCKISIPAAVTLEVEKADGDVRVKQVAGTVRIDKVGGQLYVEQAGSVDVEKVGSDCELRLIEKFRVTKVGGDLTGEGISYFSFGKTGGDLQVQCGVLGHGGKAGGDIYLACDQIENEAVELHSGGETHLFVPAAFNAGLEVHSGEGTIQIKVGEQQVELDDTQKYSLPLGSGSPHLTLFAGAGVYVTDKPWKPENFSFEDSFEFNFDFSGFPGMPDPERIARHASRAAGRAAAKAARAVEHASHNATSRVMHRAERRVHDAMRNFGFQEPDFSGPMRSAPESPIIEEPQAEAGVSEEERLIILRMLEEKKITLEQAEALLEALEGRKTT